MKTGRVAVGLLMVILGVATQATAAPKLGTGTRQLGLSGSLSDTDDGMTLNIDATAGYFVMQNLEVGARLFWHYDSPGNQTIADFAVGVFGEYHFIVPTLLVVPYAGASVSPGYWSGGTARAGDSGFYLELRGWGGVKYFLVEALSVGCQAEINLATDDVYNRGGRDGDMADWRLMLRTDFYF